MWCCLKGSSRNEPSVSSSRAYSATFPGICAASRRSRSSRGGARRVKSFHWNGDALTCQRERSDSIRASRPIIARSCLRLVRTLSPHGTREMLCVGLPRRMRCREHFVNARRLRGGRRVVERMLAISNVSEKRCPRETPRGTVARSSGRSDARSPPWHDASAVGRQNHQDEQHAACGGGNYEEIGGHQLYDVIGQERAPRLGGRWLAATDVRRDRDLRDADAELQQFAVNPRRLKGVASAMVRISVRTSRAMVGRPRR